MGLGLRQPRGFDLSSFIVIDFYQENPQLAVNLLAWWALWLIQFDYKIDYRSVEKSVNSVYKRSENHGFPLKHICIDRVIIENWYKCAMEGLFILNFINLIIYCHRFLSRKPSTCSKSSSLMGLVVDSVRL